MNLLSRPDFVINENDLMEIFGLSLATQQIASNQFSPDTNEPLEFQTVLTPAKSMTKLAEFADELPKSGTIHTM